MGDGRRDHDGRRDQRGRTRRVGEWRARAGPEEAVDEVRRDAGRRAWVSCWSCHNAGKAQCAQRQRGLVLAVDVRRGAGARRVGESASGDDHPLQALGARDDPSRDCTQARGTQVPRPLRQTDSQAEQATRVHALRHSRQAGARQCQGRPRDHRLQRADPRQGAHAWCLPRDDRRHRQGQASQQAQAGIVQGGQGRQPGVAVSRRQPQSLALARRHRIRRMRQPADERGWREGSVGWLLPGAVEHRRPRGHRADQLHRAVHDHHAEHGDRLQDRQLRPGYPGSQRHHPQEQGQRQRLAGPGQARVLRLVDDDPRTPRSTPARKTCRRSAVACTPSSV